MSDNAFHLGLGENATGIDPTVGCFPAGQGVGGIEDLVPAGELVRRFVAEAEEALGRGADSMSKPTQRHTTPPT